MFLNNEVQNEKEAYLLGLLYSDGFVTNKVNDVYYSVGITTSIKDKDLILNISKYFHRPIIKYKCYSCQTGSFEAISLNIFDVKLVKRLIHLGIKPNKTYENDSFVFDNVPLKLKHHFLRGYFDGDGTVGIYNNRCQFGFISCNKSLIEKIREYLKDNIGTSASLRIEKDKYYRLNVSGNCISKKFKNLIYDDSNIFLKRKYDIFNNINPSPKKKNTYVGITKYHNKWKASLYIGHHKYLGLFSSELEALEEYNKFAKLYGKKEQELL